MGGTLSGTAVDKEMKESYQNHQVEIKDGFRKAGWLAGVYTRVPFKGDLYGEAGFNVVNRGFRVRLEGHYPIELKENSLYLELPIQMRKELGNFFVQAGIKPGYWLSRVFTETNNFPEPVKYWGFNQGDAQFTRLNLGFNLGIGYKLPFFEGSALSLEYTQLSRQERESTHFVILRGSSYLSLTAKMDLANTNQLVRDSLGIYFKAKVGTDVQLGYTAQLGDDMFERKNPFSPKAGIVVGKYFGKWEVETGALYLQRKKLFGGHMLVGEPDDPIRTLLHSGMQLRTAIIEVPLKANYHLNSAFYATAGVSPQFVLNQWVDIYVRESRVDMNYFKEDRKQLWSISGGAGYKLPNLAGHPLYIEASVQRGLTTISSYRNSALAYVPLVASISLDVEL